jgi:hypothetical protein
MGRPRPLARARSPAATSSTSPPAAFNPTPARAVRWSRTSWATSRSSARAWSRPPRSGEGWPSTPPRPWRMTPIGGVTPSRRPSTSTSSRPSVRRRHRAARSPRTSAGPRWRRSGPPRVERSCKGSISTSSPASGWRQPRLPGAAWCKRRTCRRSRPPRRTPRPPRAPRFHRRCWRGSVWSSSTTKTPTLAATGSIPAGSSRSSPHRFPQRTGHTSARPTRASSTPPGRPWRTTWSPRRRPSRPPRRPPMARWPARSTWRTVARPRPSPGPTRARSRRRRPVAWSAGWSTPSPVGSTWSSARADLSSAALPPSSTPRWRS